MNEPIGKLINACIYAGIFLALCTGADLRFVLIVWVLLEIVGELSGAWVVVMKPLIDAARRGLGHPPH